jgi:hypothetical protein
MRVARKSDWVGMPERNKGIKHNDTKTCLLTRFRL